MFKIISHILVIIFLTILTQIGGFIYWGVILFNRKLKLSGRKFFVLFCGTYLLFTFAIVPLTAPVFGRTTLPLWGNLKPLNFMTYVLNRHYVTPELKKQMIVLSSQMNSEFEGTKTKYLDANFPFLDGFPLIPHLSHNDGRKLDVAFYYLDAITKKRSNDAPSFIGYGIYDNPKTGEVNTAKQCDDKGFWQYGILGAIVPKWDENKFIVDQKRTARLVELLSKHSQTSKIFIEPHLKQRWDLSSYENIRFHGCHAVRHDDHIHTQVN